MRILLTGGSACGKSTYAEMLAARLAAPRYYIATMRPYGEESLARIARHRELRQEERFETVERYTDLRNLTLPARGTALLECMCNWTANEMFDGAGHARDPFEDILRGVENLAAQCANLIVVTNEVGSDDRKYDASTRRYIDVLGRLNIELARRSDHVYELVCGIPLVLKGELL